MAEPGIDNAGGGALRCPGCRYDLSGQVGEAMLCPECGTEWLRGQIVSAAAIRERVGHLDRLLMIVRIEAVVVLLASVITPFVPATYPRLAWGGCVLVGAIATYAYGSRGLARLFPLWSERRVATTCVLLEITGGWLANTLPCAAAFMFSTPGAISTWRGLLIVIGAIVVGAIAGVVEARWFKPRRDRRYNELRAMIGAPPAE